MIIIRSVDSVQYRDVAEMEISGDNYEGLKVHEFPETKATVDSHSAVLFFAGLAWRDLIDKFHAHFLFDFGAWRPLPVNLSSPASMPR